MLVWVYFESKSLLFQPFVTTIGSLLAATDLWLQYVQNVSCPTIILRVSMTSAFLTMSTITELWEKSENILDF